MRDDITCPYCGEEREREIERDGHEDGDIEEVECINCDKIMGVPIYQGNRYMGDAHEMPCRNGEPCEMTGRSWGHPNGTQKVCHDCGKREFLAPGER